MSIAFVIEINVKIRKIFSLLADSLFLSNRWANFQVLLENSFSIDVLKRLLNWF